MVGFNFVGVGGGEERFYMNHNSLHVLTLLVVYFVCVCVCVFFPWTLLYCAFCFGFTCVVIVCDETTCRWLQATEWAPTSLMCLIR